MRKVILLFVCLVFFSKAIGQNLEDTLQKRVEFLSNILNAEQKREYLYNYFQDKGLIMLSPKGGDDFSLSSKEGDTLRFSNIEGLILGYDPNLRGEYIVLSAHYDNSIPPGANNNNSGVATLMEVARLISENKFVFRRSVIIALFDAGEYANAGSWYFANRSFAEIDKVLFMIDINTVGRSGASHPFQAFLGVPTPKMKSKIEQVNNRPFSLSANVIENEPFSSDFRNFYEKNIPITLFTTGVSQFRGTKNDLPTFLDYFNMKQIVEYIYSYALVVANSDKNDLSPLPSEEISSTSSPDRIYSQREVDRRASFMKSDERLFLKDWVYKYVSYPESSLNQGVEGVVDVEFVVNQSGEIEDIKILKSVDDAIDAEVVKVIKASPKWTPATIGGKRVKVKIALSVEFRATKEGSRVGIKW